MAITQLQRKYELAKAVENLPEEEIVERTMDFIEVLLSDNSDDIKEYHYNLLRKRENENLYYSLRVAFKKRPGAESFLLKQLPTETDPITSGDILHILGGLRSSHAAPLARQFINNHNDFQREVALYVLGWVGIDSDIAILNEHLLKESSPYLRIIAASAHRQMYWRLTELKTLLLASLKQGYEMEKDDAVITQIIIMIESIALKRLGLREDTQDPSLIHGDIQKAKIKTTKFLSEVKL